MRPLPVIAVLAAALGGLWLLTVAGESTTCEVCAFHQGQEACKTATAATAEEAIQHAQATACALVTRGVTEDLACQRATPRAVRCN